MSSNPPVLSNDYVQSFRRAFRVFVPREDLDKFMRVIHRTTSSGRLKYWQEMLLDSFCKENGFTLPSIDELPILFNFCHLHDMELLPDIVPILFGTRRLPSHEKRQFEAQNFPFANLVADGPCWMASEITRKINYCPKCRGQYRLAHD